MIDLKCDSRIIAIEMKKSDLQKPISDMKYQYAEYFSVSRDHIFLFDENNNLLLD